MGTTYDENYTDKTYARIDMGAYGPGYLTGELPPRYTYDSTTGELALIWGEFNTYDKWGEDVTNMYVTSVTATDQVSFTGDCSQLFYNFKNCTSMDLNLVNTSEMTSAKRMFRDCENLTELDISNWDTGNVTDMNEMFLYCVSLDSLNLTGWNTANVTDMGRMFEGCTSLDSLDLSGFNTENATIIYYMFNNCSNLVSLKLSGWNTSQVTALTQMFNGCENLASLDLTGWNTEQVIAMNNMFAGCSSLTEIDLTGISTEQVTNMNSMFYGCSSLTSLDVSGFNTSNVTDMMQMFAHCDSLKTLDLSSFNTANVMYMDGMFQDCDNLTTIIPGLEWNTDMVSSSEDMFSGCVSLVGSMGTTYDPEHTDKTYARVDMGEYEPGYFTGELPPRYIYDDDSSVLTLIWGEFNKDDKWGEDVLAEAVGSVTSTGMVSFTGDCSELFNGFSQCSSMDLSRVNTSGMTNASAMFQSCEQLAVLNLLNWTTDSVIDMSSMFQDCDSLRKLNLVPFNTGNVTNMASMFAGCDSLTTIYVGPDWNTDSVTISEDMFNVCVSLVGSQGTVYDENFVDKTYAHIDGGAENPGYLSEEYILGDVNVDNGVNISDVTALIDYLLNGNAVEVSLAAADCNKDGAVNISDVTSLIDFLLSGVWP